MKKYRTNWKRGGAKQRRFTCKICGQKIAHAGICKECEAWERNARLDQQAILAEVRG